ncbi:radical SAM protein [uncultured Rhodoblastus sp.]|uniref:radical SAM protein n=1 Tax=uncultured Rhodoblastus sp. TaxID=543037 RepID=UPI0025DB7F8B|nr:radical SAM protein [uncultured Rhodoblastus sp.]
MQVLSFSVGGQSFLYSAWTNRICRVNAELCARFSAEDASDETLSLARHLGLLPPHGHQIEILPNTMIDSMVDSLEQQGPTVLVLGITEACNFRCKYCAYSGAYSDERAHGNINMSPHIASKAIDWYLSFPRAQYQIGFYGGEPMLAYELIQGVVLEARRRQTTCTKLTFTMTTNGSLFDDSKINFLADNDFQLFVSLDGPQSIHDRYRQTVKGRPTFNAVWQSVKRFREQRPDYFDRNVNFSITLAPPCDIQAIEQFLIENREIFGEKVPKIGVLNSGSSHVMEALGVPSDEERIDMQPLRDDYFEAITEGKLPTGLARACIEGAVARVHNRSMGPATRITTSAGQCAPGARCMVAPDGRYHMCEHGNQRRPIGSVESGWDTDRIRSMLREFGDFVQTRCRDCWAVRLCTKCFANLSEGDALSGSRFAAVCAARRRSLKEDLIYYCRARLKSNGCFDILTRPGKALQGSKP